jgi:hypothetical protein
MIICLKIFYHLFKYLTYGDVVIAYVNYVNETGIHLTMSCFDNFKRRDLTHIKLEVILLK